MVYINSPLNQIILYVGSEGRKATQTLAYCKTHGLAISLINLQKVKLTGTHILELTKMLCIEPKDLANMNDPIYREKVGELHSLDHEDWLKVFAAHPEIMRTPIAVKGGKAILVETPSDILKLY